MTFVWFFMCIKQLLLKKKKTHVLLFCSYEMSILLKCMKTKHNISFLGLYALEEDMDKEGNECALKMACCYNTALRS